MASEQKVPKNWRDNFDERQQKEILLAQVYAKNFAHGTTGHNALMVIDKLAQMLDRAAGNPTQSDDR